MRHVRIPSEADEAQILCIPSFTFLVSCIDHIFDFGELFHLCVRLARGKKSPSLTGDAYSQLGKNSLDYTVYVLVLPTRMVCR